MQKERRIGREVDRRVNVIGRVDGKRAPFPWQRMEKILGRGKFGTVYAAINQRTKQMMAVKQLQRTDQRELMGLIDEVKAIMPLRHPNLVEYFGYEVHRVSLSIIMLVKTVLCQDELLIFMTFCNEGTLEKLCTQSCMDIDLVRLYTRLLLNGVAYLHKHNIVHRDIKRMPFTSDISDTPFQPPTSSYRAAGAC